MTETRQCDRLVVHGWHHWYIDGVSRGGEDLVRVRCEGLEERRCPDGGYCHHACEKACFRVQFAGPLSGVYPGNAWPVEVREEHDARWRFGYNSPEEVVEQHIFNRVAEDDCDHPEKMWACSVCISGVAVRETRRLIADEIERMAVEYASDPAEGRTAETMRAIRVEWVREVARRVAQEAK